MSSAATMPDAIEAEVLAAVRDKDLAPKIAEQRQLEREQQRAELLRQLATQQAADATASETNAQRRDAARLRLHDAEAAVVAARRLIANVDAADSLVGQRAERLRGELRKLSDPRLDRALVQINNFAELARKSFKTRSRSERADVFGGRVEVDVGNSLDVAEALDACREAHERIEALRYAARPSDLAAVIEKIIYKPRLLVQKLTGTQ